MPHRSADRSPDQEPEPLVLVEHQQAFAEPGPELVSAQQVLAGRGFEQGLALALASVERGLEQGFAP